MRLKNNNQSHSDRNKITQIFGFGNTVCNVLHMNICVRKPALYAFDPLLKLVPI